jgi:hypothetical protein
MIGSAMSCQSPITVISEVDWLASKPKMLKLSAKIWIAIS